VSKVHGGKILPIARLIAVLSRVNIFPFKKEVTNFIVPPRDKALYALHMYIIKERGK
jgi:hypothetical protein